MVWTALDAGEVEVEATVAPADESDALLPHAPVLITGMAMVEAYETRGGEAVGGPSVWDVYLAPEGPAVGVAMVATIATGGLEIRSHGLDGRMLVESPEFVDGRWRLGSGSSVGEPMDTVDLADSSQRRASHHTTFAGPHGDEASP